MNFNQWKINFVLLLFVSSLVMVTMLIVGTDILKDLKVKETQINNLIDEVGALRGEKETGTVTHSSARPLATTDIYNPNQGVIDRQTLLLESTAGQKVYLIVGQHSKLTDTIMVGVVDHDKKRITLMSIPRDFYINGRKINEYYEFFGIQKLADQIAKITNLTVDKYVIVDMQSFKTFVDKIGGVDVYVEKGLVDTLYPTEKKGYQTFSISKGLHHLDGDTALKYARSRESTSDFDRAKRQQQVIKAIKDTLEKKENLIQLISDVYGSIKGNVETNITYIDALMTFNTVRGYAISSDHVLSTSNLLYSTYSTGGQYILLPKDKNYSEIQKTINDWLNQ